jgi:hypothetical protein
MITTVIQDVNGIFIEKYMLESNLLEKVNTKSLTCRQDLQCNYT